MQEPKLAPMPTGASDYYYDDEYWEEHIGSFFIDLTKEEREDYMAQNYFPKAAPKTMNQFRAHFEKFHKENVNGVTGLNSLTVNVIGNCFEIGLAGCGDWSTIGDWEGVDLYFEKDLFSDSETYDLIVKQTADAVERQLVAKDLAIKK